jgi:hypothetical protein
MLLMGEWDELDFLQGCTAVDLRCLRHTRNEETRNAYKILVLKILWK